MKMLKPFLYKLIPGSTFFHLRLTGLFISEMLFSSIFDGCSYLLSLNAYISRTQIAMKMRFPPLERAMKISGQEKVVSDFHLGP